MSVECIVRETSVFENGVETGVEIQAGAKNPRNLFRFFERAVWRQGSLRTRRTCVKNGRPDLVQHVEGRSCRRKNFGMVESDVSQCFLHGPAEACGTSPEEREGNGNRRECGKLICAFVHLQSECGEIEKR